MTALLKNFLTPDSSFFLIDAGCKFALSLIQAGVPGKNITIWETFGKYYAFAEKMQKIYGFNLVKEIPVIEFDVSVSNVPYSLESHNTGSSTYESFAQIQYDRTKEGGIMIAVHPPGMRKPNSDYRNLLIDNQVEKLSIHSSDEGKKNFKANTPYDWYVLRKIPRTGPTQVRFEKSEKWVDVDFRDFPFIPNHSLDILKKYINTDASIPRLNPQIGRAWRHISRSKTYDPMVPFEGAYVSINKTTATGELNLCYNKVPQPEADKKKVVFREGGNFYPYYDDGQYGVSDNCMYVLVDSKEEADDIIEYLNSPEANQWRLASQISGGFRTVCDMLKVIPNPHYVKKAKES